MAWDFSTEPEFQEKLDWMQVFLREEILPLETIAEEMTAEQWKQATDPLKEEVKRRDLWACHLDPELGGQGYGQVKLALMHEILGRSPIAPPIFGNSAPDSGNAELLAIGGDAEQKRRWMEPLLAGELRSAFSMTEPEVAGSDPTLIRTQAVLDGDEYVINGHKWFTSGAHGAHFAIVIAKTDPDASIAQARNSAFIVPTNTPGFEIVRDISTMGGGGGHPEIRYNDVRVPHANMLGEQGGGHKLGQVRLGPARLAHCMRWLGTIEQALEMLVDRAQKRYAHGSLLSEKQGIQWMMAESALELYASKLMVLHAAYKIEKGMDFRAEVSMAKHHVANTLWKTVDRALQVHGALGYSNDSPLAQMLIQARWSRIADGSDEVHLMRIAEMVMRSYNETGSVNHAVGDLPL